MKRQFLTQAEFDQLCSGAQVLEQDAHGIKVLKLAEGDILKLFRIKRAWSSARWMPYSRRFWKNALRLADLGVPSITPRAWYQLPAPQLTAVLYQPLPGYTLLQLATAGELTSPVLRQLGVFVARLHRLGIYFRSLHLGNIVQTPSGELGLIDVADMTVHPWHLLRGQRLRNFRHLLRLQEHRRLMGQDGWQTLVSAYLDEARPRPSCRPGMQQAILDLFTERAA